MGVYCKEYEDAFKGYYHVKLMYEEASTASTQIQASLNSRLLSSIASVDNKEGIEILTPVHFLIRRPLAALPDPPSSYNETPTMRGLAANKNNKIVHGNYDIT